MVAAGAALQDYKRFSASLRLRYFGPRPLTSDAIYTSPSTALVNLGGSYKINKNWSLWGVAASREGRRLLRDIAPGPKDAFDVVKTMLSRPSPTRPGARGVERLGAGSATITELAEPFGMSLTGMKKHIRLLEEANLVSTGKVGRARQCTLVPYAFEGISTWLARLDRFAEVVQRTKGAA